MTVPCPTYGSLPSTPNRPPNPADPTVTNMAATYSTYCTQPPSAQPDVGGVSASPIYSTYATRSAAGIFPSLDSNQSVPLATFVEDQQKSFPTCVQVMRGYCGSTERDMVSAGDIYNFHFVKRTEVIHIEDSKGTKYSIPLNSAVQCGIVYGLALIDASGGGGGGGGETPGYDGDKCTFGSIGELMAANPLPWLVRAIGSHQASDPRSIVEENELFIVNKTTRKVRRFGQQSLKVYSLTHQESKVLHSDCSVSFTASPLSVLLYPPEIMLHFPKAFPMQAVLYFGNDTAENIPEQLLAEVVTLVRHSVERSIIVTSCLGNGRVGGGGMTDVGMPMEIPVQLDIEVVAVPSELVERDEQLCAQTRSLLRDFNPSMVRSCGGGKGTQAFQALRQGYESVGLELEPPSSLYSEIRPRQQFVRPTLNSNSSLPHPAPPAAAQIPPPLPANAPPARRLLFSSSAGDIPSLVRAPPNAPIQKSALGLEEEEAEGGDEDRAALLQDRSAGSPVASRPLSDDVVDNTLYGASDLSVQVHVVRRMVETMQSQVDMAESTGRKNGNALMAVKSEVWQVKGEVGLLARAVEEMRRQLDELREMVGELMQCGVSGMVGAGGGRVGAGGGRVDVGGGRVGAGGGMVGVGGGRVPITPAGQVSPSTQPCVPSSAPPMAPPTVSAGAVSPILQTIGAKGASPHPTTPTFTPSPPLPVLSAPRPTSPDPASLLSLTTLPHPPITSPHPPITSARPPVAFPRPPIATARPPTNGVATPATVANKKVSILTPVPPTSSSLPVQNRSMSSKEENKEALKKFDQPQVSVRLLVVVSNCFV